ncbi:MAG: GFA family protein [Candidatus Phaeomarinobacter sp.]
MSDRHQGSCLCGEVHFEVSGKFQHFFLCHCGRCQKDTGSAHAANLFSSNATIKWLSGQDSIKEYVVPDTRHTKCFCPQCGAAVPSIQMNGTLLVVPAGSLDSPVEIRPTAHICVASRANWDRKLEDIPKIDALPK